MAFRKDFVWGVATASYQIEGAWDADGKGPSVWDMLVRKPDAINHGSTGDVACDHYHRYLEDIKLMQALGVKAYRLSLSWPRIMPNGIGTVNQAGLDFYSRVIDALLAAGITPYVTLFHWDYPLALHQQGGWLNPLAPEWFAAYTKVVAQALGDRVRNWMTLNEPQCIVGLGHQAGTHAPGLKLNFSDTLVVTHRVLLAHGRAVQVLREFCPQSPTIGWAPVGIVSMPTPETPENTAAARKGMFEITSKGFWVNTWFSDPAIFGHYPEDGVRLFGWDMPKFPAADMRTICQPIDFYGVNIYNGAPCADDGKGGVSYLKRPEGFARTMFDWPLEERSLYWGPKLLQERYKLPLMITENGMSGHDWVALDGKVHDEYRIDFTRRYLQQLRRACADGVDIRGYFHWTLMDNFEWAEGYKQRFGMIHVDFNTQVRTIKESGHWYRSVITANGTNL
ncbi:MAG: GH1 family beta-glucosidase [Phycisphaerae bacterium]